MGTLLGDAAVCYKEDAVTEAGGRQSVGDEHGGLTRRHIAVLLVNIVFRNGIQRRRRLVQNEDGPVLIKRSRQHQPPQYADYTLFVAEVASTVNENLLIEHLLAEKNQDPATRLALLNQYLENFKGTVYRQTMFAEFERDAHAMAERGEALNPAALNNLYKKLIVDYFGPELVVDDEVQYEWARIPHFYRPFYVYKYATGYSTAVALSEGILKNGEPAVKKYLEFLHMGGSAYPLDELRHAGVDLTTPAPVDAALDKFGRILDEAEACVAQLEAAK